MQSENGGIDESVVIIEKEQSSIDYDSVRNLKQVVKLKAARILARAKSDRIRRLAASQQSPFQGDSTAKSIIPNKPKRGHGYYPFGPVDPKKLSVLIDWVQLDP